MNSPENNVYWERVKQTRIVWSVFLAVQSACRMIHPSARETIPLNGCAQTASQLLGSIDMKARG